MPDYPGIRCDFARLIFFAAFLGAVFGSALPVCSQALDKGSLPVSSTFTDAGAGGFAATNNSGWVNDTNQNTVARRVVSVPAKPGLLNTGWQGKLTPAAGMTVTVAGTILENLDVTGTVTVKAKNVTIRNCRINAGSFYGIKCTSGFSGLLIENCELTGASSAMIFGGNFTARRLNIHHGGSDGIKATHDVLVEQCWIHHLGMTPTAHADGVQTHGGGGSNFIYRYNNFDLPSGLPGFVSNSAFILEPDGGLLTDVLINRNWLNGGNYTIYGSGMSGVMVTNNKFGRGYRYGIRSKVLVENWVANVWEDDGTPAQ